MDKIASSSTSPSPSPGEGDESSDSKRYKRLYQYLLTLTDLNKEKDSQSYNESYISLQWGLDNNRMFVRRVVRSIFPEKYKDKDYPVPRITLHKLVQILASIDKYRQDQSERVIGKFPPILTRSEKLRALNLYVELLPKERDELNLKQQKHELLLQKLVEEITDRDRGLSVEQTNRISKFILDSYDLEIGRNSCKRYELDSMVKDTINRVSKEHIQYLAEDQQEEIKNKVFNIVKDAIRGIEYQTGSYQLKKYLEDEAIHLRASLPLSENQDWKRQSEKIKNQMQEIDAKFNPEFFVEKLTRATIDNEILTQDFPIHLKSIEFKEVQSLPKDASQSARDYRSMQPNDESIDLDFNHDYVDYDQISAYTVRVYFYFFNHQGKRIEFHEDATGVGSPMSHAIAAINRALIWDIPSLKDYLPIAKQLMLHHEIVGSSTNGAVWTHYVVGLCKRSEINYALENKKDSFSIDNISSSDYCGFDIVEVSAKSAFYARLKAIKKTGVSPAQYIRQLETKISNVREFRKCERILNEYPFSRVAMQSALEENLRQDRHKQDSKSLASNSNPNSPWSLTQYEAHLLITETYFKEGLYAIGKQYLDIIERHISKYQGDPINKIVVARYHLCYFRYHYLTDLSDPTYLNNSRAAAVENAKKSLDRAYENLRGYVDKCNLIDELPHINFYDFFVVMSKLYADRAKLHLFMSTYQANQSIQEPIALFREARICAARSGNSSLYAMWSAYQSWCYLIAAYEQENIDRQKKYIDRAADLLDDAFIAYEKTGRSYYESIKQASGKSIYEDYGRIKIQPMPSIKEFESQVEGSYYEIIHQEADSNIDRQSPHVNYDREKNTLTLDMSTLNMSCSKITDSKKTYLFGTQASILIFAKAMLDLCQYDLDSSPASIDRIKKAKKMFTYSWSFASHGLREDLKNHDDGKRYDRLFETDVKEITKDIKEKESNRITAAEINSFEKFLEQDLESQYLRGLHPHRLTQFVDFGKIYYVACELILLSQPDPELESVRWIYIKKIVKDLANKSYPVKFEGSQTRYNGHLQEHFSALDKYVDSFEGDIKKQSPKHFDLKLVRDRVVRDFAIILRTGRTQISKLSG